MCCLEDTHFEMKKNTSGNETDGRRHAMQIVSQRRMEELVQ